MSRLFLPTILVLAAIGLFTMYTHPAYQGTKGLRAEVQTYDDALNKSQELRTLRDEKIAAYNTLSQVDKDRLEQVLPDNVDNIHLIIDINTIAARHGLSLKNVELGELSDRAGGGSDLAVGASGDAVGSVSLGFTFGASYEDFLAFLQDIEHSLRVVDVREISFTVPQEGLTDYTFNIRTYWLH